MPSYTYPSLSATLTVATALCLTPFLLNGCGGGGGSNSNPVKVPVPTTDPKATPTAIPTPLPTIQPPAGELMSVACVGDSITAGVGIKNPKKDSYPIVLGKALGSGFQVNNYGHSGTIAAKDQTQSYDATSEYHRALTFKPDIVVMALGTNDSYAKFNREYTANFVDGYEGMIAAFKKANPTAEIFVCLPPPYYPTNSDHNDKLQDAVVPLIKQVATESEATLVDFYTPLLNKPGDFNGLVHPNEAGAKVLAGEVYKAIAKELAK